MITKPSLLRVTITVKTLCSLYTVYLFHVVSQVMGLVLEITQGHTSVLASSQNIGAYEQGLIFFCCILVVNQPLKTNRACCLAKNASKFVACRTSKLGILKVKEDGH